MEAACVPAVDQGTAELASQRGPGAAGCPHEDLDAILASVEELGSPEAEQLGGDTARAAMSPAVPKTAAGGLPKVNAEEPPRAGIGARDAQPRGGVAAGPAVLLPPPPAIWSRRPQSGASHTEPVRGSSAGAAAMLPRDAAADATAGAGQGSAQPQEALPLTVQLSGSSGALVPVATAEPLAGLSATHGARVARLRAGAAPEGAVLVRRQRHEGGVTTPLLTIGPEDAPPSYIGQVIPPKPWLLHPFASVSLLVLSYPMHGYQSVQFNQHQALYKTTGDALNGARSIGMSVTVS